LKYASDEGTKISVEHKKDENKLFLHVENFSSKENIKILLSEVEQINSGEPQEVYLMKMQEAALRTDGGSQLGLARIRYESDAFIKVDVDNDLVKVTVVFDLK
ncbi:MAG TPA: hypothetical protein PLI57_05085, partial [Spirochaetota bacterium]|nr:hypothetical protein [Spirochaetota bacterium]